MKRILVVRPSSLGDVVYALAIAADIRAACPGASVDWVAEEGFAELPKLSRDVDRVIPVALRRWRGALARGATWREFAGFRHVMRERRYDAVIDLQEQLKGALIARLARGRRHGLAASSIREPVATLFHHHHHAVERDIHFVAKCRAIAAGALGYAPEGPPRWHWHPLAATAAMPRGPSVAMLTATSRPGKLWPEDRWRALAAHVAGAGFAVVLPWGTPEECARAERIAEGVAGAVVPPRQPLADLAALLAHVDAAVGVDTGLTHLAAALGTPTVALFTETDAALAGVAVCGAPSQDLGGNGVVPSLAEAVDALGVIWRATPRC